MHSVCTSTTSGTWIVDQTLKMCIWRPLHGIPRHDHWTRGNQDGQKEVGSHKGMEAPYLHQRNLVIHWICELLQEIHPRLFQHCSPPQLAHSQRGTLGLDPTPTACLRTSQTHLLLRPCSMNPWCDMPLFYHDWHLPTSSWSGAHASWWKLWPAPLCILLSCFLLCSAQLWHLWLGICMGMALHHGLWVWLPSYIHTHTMGFLSELNVGCTTTSSSHYMYCRKYCTCWML